MKKCTLITVIIHHTLQERLVTYLKSMGINNLYSALGRSMNLNDSKGFFSLLKKNELISEQVDVFYFYTSNENENFLLESIIHFSRLDIPGRGSVFSQNVEILTEKCQTLLCQLNKQVISTDFPEKSSTFNRLVHIKCTVNKGLADEISRMLLHLGIVPVITNASGTGLRDRLGLLRITIPKDKELISIVIGEQESKSVVEKIIVWAKLDKPGRGFIWQTPLNQGLVNHKTSTRATGQVASLEQIIATLDSIKGTIDWRQSNSLTHQRFDNNLYSGQELFIQAPEGTSTEITQLLFKLGISGATVQSIKTNTLTNEMENIVTPQEIIRIVTSNSHWKKIIEELSAIMETHLGNTGIFLIETTRAYNYKSFK